MALTEVLKHPGVMFFAATVISTLLVSFFLKSSDMISSPPTSSPKGFEGDVKNHGLQPIHPLVQNIYFSEGKMTKTNYPGSHGHGCPRRSKKCLDHCVKEEGYSTGICINEICQCMDNIEDGGCDTVGCAIQCILTGALGICIGGTCICIPIPITGQNSLKTYGNELGQRRCPSHPRACAKFCDEKGFSDGVCVGEDCKCIKNKEEDGCDWLTCLLQCLPEIATCIDDMCICFPPESIAGQKFLKGHQNKLKMNALHQTTDPGLRSETAFSTASGEMVENDIAVGGKHGCPDHPSECDGYCKSLGYRKGYCIGNSCNCSGKPYSIE